MTPAEIARLLKTIRAFDNRIGEPNDYVIAAWLDSAKRRNWDLPAALNAVGEYYADNSRALIMPGDITRIIRAERHRFWEQ
ncbi:hypothetical protein [Nocardia africana]